MNISKYESLFRSINREPSRRSVYLSKFLRRRPTYEELKAQGIVKVCYNSCRIFVVTFMFQDNSVFGCKIEHQRLISGKTLQVPMFVWKCIEKIESKKGNLATEGLYRISGDAVKMQKLRLDIDQVSCTWIDFRF